MAQQTSWEGALGMVGRNAPTYMGSAERHTAASPGFYLRYGRFSVTNASGFVTRRANDDLEPGMAAELLKREDWRLSASLRWDAGRHASSGNVPPGQGDVSSTVRARLSASYKVDAHWRAGLATSIDLLGHDGGTLLEASLGRGQRLSPHWTWRYGASLTAASRRYQESYFGIDAAHAAASGLPEYSPPSGLRDFGLGTGVSADFGGNWIGFANLGVGTLLGPAKASPLTQRRSSVGATLGVAWRF